MSMQVAELPKHLVQGQMVPACHSILFDDCEENGMISQRILFEVHETYKQALEEQSKPFFTWLEQVRNAVEDCMLLFFETRLLMVFCISLPPMSLAALWQLARRISTVFGKRWRNSTCFPSSRQPLVQACFGSSTDDRLPFPVLPQTASRACWYALAAHGKGKVVGVPTVVIVVHLGTAFLDYM